MAADRAAGSPDDWSPPLAQKLVRWLEAGNEFDRILRVALVLTPALRLATYITFDWELVPVVWMVDLMEQRNEPVPALLRVLAREPIGYLALCHLVDALMFWKEGRFPVWLQRTLNIAWVGKAALAGSITVAVMIATWRDFVG